MAKKAENPSQIPHLRVLGEWTDSSTAPLPGGAEFTPITAGNAAVQAAVMAYFDQALRRSEQQSRDQLALLQAIYASAPVGLAFIDPELRYVNVNEHLARINGKTVKEHLGQPIRNILPDLADEIESCCLRVLQSGQGISDIEIQYPRDVAPENCRYWIASYEPVKSDTGIIGVNVAIREVTKRKRVETLLQHSEKRFHNLVEATSDWVWEVDADGVYTFSSGQVKKILGYTPAEVIGKTPFAFMSPEEADRVARIVGDHAARQEPLLCLENINLHKDGRQVVLETSGMPVFDATGKFCGYRGIDRDITQRKRVEEVMAKAKEVAESANLAKDRFLANLSHELRTPLTPILLGASLLEQRQDLPDDLRKEIEGIRRNAQLEARIIDDILDLNRIVHGKMRFKFETLNVHQVISRAVEICNQGDGPQINVGLCAANYFARGDSVRLQQVFWNLLNNARKFTPADGKVVVRSRNEDECSLRIDVIDTGVGIAKAYLDKIFDAFEQGDPSRLRQFGGLGLGLSISRAIMEAHGGTLTVSSAGIGQGATFTVTLPVVMKLPEMTSVTPAPAVLPAAARLRILLVEDHVPTLKMMLKLIAGFGHDVQGAGSMDAARKLTQKETFDLVISDLSLPDGSGHDLMRELKAQFGIRGIALSGYGMEQDVRQSQEAGFAEHLTKPVEMQVLRDAIQRAAQK